MLDKFLVASAWKSCEWLVRRFVSRDDAALILAHLHAVLEKPEVLTAAKAFVEAVKSKNPIAIVAAGEELGRVLKG